MTGLKKKKLCVGGYVHLHSLAISAYKNMVDLKTNILKLFIVTKSFLQMCICLYNRSNDSLESISQPLLITICIFCCRIPHLLAISVPSPSCLFRCLRLDVLLKFLNAEVAVLVKLGQRLLHPQRCEAGLWALVPALLHYLHDGCQDLQHAMAGVKWNDFI